MSATLIKLKQLPSDLTLAWMARRNVWVSSKPGIGKTFSVWDWAKEMQRRIESFRLWQLYGPTLGPSDIQMTMPDMTKMCLQFLSNGSLPNAYATPDALGAVFMDEFGNTDPTVAKLAQKYIRGEDINGTLRKPDGISVIVASNRMQDKAGVIQQFRALLNSFTHLDAYTDAEDNIAYAQNHDWHPMVQTFFKEWPALIDNYDDIFSSEEKKGKNVALVAEEGKRGVWANMRAWDAVHRLETKAEEFKVSVSSQMVCGTVGTGVGSQYLTHRAMFGRLASVEEIVKDPKKVKMPEKIDEQYAQAVVLCMRITIKDLPKCKIYVDRGIPKDMQAMMLRRMLERSKREPTFDVSRTETYKEWISDPMLRDLVMAR